MKVFIYLSTLVLMLLTQQAFGNIDSLERRLKQNPDDTTRVQLYLKLTWAYKDSDPAKAREMVLKASQFARTSGYSAGEANALYYLAILHYLEGEYDQAALTIGQAKPIYKKLKNDYGLTSLLNLLGLMQLQQSLYPEALASFQEVYRLGEKNNDLYSLSNSLNNMAMVYERTGEQKKSLQMNLKSLEVRKRIGNEQFIGESMLEIGISYFHLKQFDSSRYYLLEAKPVFEKIKSTRGLGSVYNSLGIIAIDEEQFGVAKHYLLLSEKLIEPLDDKHLFLPILVNLGIVYTQLGQYKEASAYLSRCREMSEKVHDLRNLSLALEWSSLLAEKQGNYKQAMLDERARLAANDSMLNEDKNKLLAEMNAKFETAIKEKQIASQALQIQTQENSLLRQRFWITGLFVLVMLALIAAVVFVWRIRTKNKLALKQAVIQEQKRGIQAVLEATEQERRKIARDLHDSLAQQLAALKIGLGRFRDKSTVEEAGQLDPLLELASSSAEEARNISHALLPKTLITLGLMPAITELLRKSLEPAGIGFFVDASDTLELDENTAVVIYRVVQELTNNVLKHSGADFVVCRFKEQQGKLLLSYEDNGKGFDILKIQNGLGMMNMRTRLQALDGDLQFVANEDGGVRAEIRLSVSNLAAK